VLHPSCGILYLEQSTISAREDSMEKPQCPGKLRRTVPVPLERTCPRCREVVEIFSDEEKATCKCGASVFKDPMPSCAEWCPAAEKCLGDVVDVEELRRIANKRGGTDRNPDFVMSVCKLIQAKRQ